MSKFWSVAIILLLGGIALVAADRAEADKGISFTDLETECRYDRSAQTDIDLQAKRLRFSGNFPVENPDARLNYNYRVSNSNIRLNVFSRGGVQLTDFFNTCKASVIYEARTERLDEGRYTVTVLHNGEKNEKMVLNVK